MNQQYSLDFVYSIIITSQPYENSLVSILQCSK